LLLNGKAFDRPNLGCSLEKESTMKRSVSLLIVVVLLALSASCSTNTSTVELRGTLINYPEDYFLVVCETGERVTVEIDAMQPWWSQMASPVDAGGLPLTPPMYVDMRAKVESGGPYGMAVKTNRRVVHVEEVRTLTATIPGNCLQ
jgi:hypothetical protein